MLYTIKNEFLTVAVSDFAGELQSIRTPDGAEHLWQGNALYWERRAPLLFPFCGRFWGGHATVNGVPCNPGAHGFLQHRTMRLVSHSSLAVTLRLDADAETLTLYPFDFSFLLTYTLHANTLTVQAEIRNNGKTRMFYGYGGHPGFCLPDAAKGLNSHYLVFSGTRAQKINFDENNFFPTGGSVPFPLGADGRFDLRDDLFATGSFFLCEMPEQVTLTSDHAPHSITLSYPGFPFLGFWKNPSPDARFLCIEPWCGMPSHSGEITELTTHSELQRLAADQVNTHTFTVRIS